MGRIIVIEDNLVFADYVCRLLASKGFKSETVFTCNGARKLFSKMQEFVMQQVIATFHLMILQTNQRLFSSKFQTKKKADTELQQCVFPSFIKDLFRAQARQRN